VFELSLVMLFLDFFELEGLWLTGLLTSSALRTMIVSSNLPNVGIPRVSSSSSLLSLRSIAKERPFARPSTIVRRVCMTMNAGRLGRVEFYLVLYLCRFIIAKWLEGKTYLSSHYLSLLVGICFHDVAMVLFRSNASQIDRRTSCSRNIPSRICR